MAYEICENEYFGQNPEIVEAIRKMCLFDDTFMSTVFSRPECAEYLLRILLDKKDLSVLSAVRQYEIKNIYGRSVKLDIYAKDSTGKLYNVEVQRDNHGAMPKRARYNSSLLDAHSIEKGNDWDKLPETYVIFITENDYFKKGEPLYMIDRINRTTGELFDDEEHIIYVNGKNTSDTELGRLMQDFSEVNPDKFNHKMLGDEVRHYKYREEGVDEMCQIVEDYAKKYAEDYAAKRAEERAVTERIQFALKLIDEGTLSFEKIATITDFSLETIKALAKSESA